MPSPTVVRAIGPIAAQLVTAAEWPVGVHVAETLLGPRPMWHWPVRTCTTDRALSARLRDTWPVGMNIAEVAATPHLGPAELLILPVHLLEAASVVASMSVPRPVAFVVVTGGGSDLPWPALRAAKDALLSATGAAGLFIDEMDAEQISRWFDQPFVFNLAHNFQLDVTVHRRNEGGLLFATDELLAESQLSNRVMAMSDLLDTMSVERMLEVPGGLRLGIAAAGPYEVSTRLRAIAPDFRYEHESDESFATANLERVIEAALVDTLRDQQPRFVNLAVAAERDQPALHQTTPLAPKTDYLLRLDIGARSRESVVLDPPPFPVHLLPPSETGHWLEVVVIGNGLRTRSRKHAMFLPDVGPAWTCPCTPGRDGHTCAIDERRPHLYVGFRTPATQGDAHLRVAIYYERNLVQSFRFTANVGARPVGLATHYATLDFTLTSGLTGLEGMPRRDLNLLVNDDDDGTHRLVVNGQASQAVALRFSESKQVKVISATRAMLRDIHIDQPGHAEPLSRYDANNAKKAKAFVADLQRLAPLGWKLWDSIVPSVTTKQRIRTWLRDAPATIQVGRVSTDFVFPWALVYDIPLDSGPQRLCEFVTRWVDGQPPPIDADGPTACPFAAGHGPNVICPFGFWGFAHVIEEPPSVEPGASLVLTINAGSPKGKAVVGRSLDLHAGLMAAHVRELTKVLSAFDLEDCDSRDDVSAALGRDNAVQLVYFYCHGLRHEADGLAWPALGVGHEEVILPSDLGAWAVGWQPDHWQATSPLVVINGCHTVEMAPDSIANLVDALVGMRAAGVVGTEVTLHQALAGEGGLALLLAFRDRLTMGEAMQRMRRSFLAKGNVMGLAYTLYCSASLRLV